MPRNNEEKTEAGVTRRTFVQAGVAGIGVVAVSGSMVSLGASETESAASTGPQIGAIYYCGYSRDGRGWEKVRRVSALGRYDSGDVGAIDTHIEWAKKMGTSFFLAATETDAATDYRTGNIARLYERADLTSFTVGLMVSAGAAAPQRKDAQAWLRTRLNNIATSGTLDRSSYLKTGGKAVVAVQSWDEPQVVSEVVSRVMSDSALRSRMAVWVIAKDGGRVARTDGFSWVTADAPSARPLFESVRGADDVVLLKLTEETRGTAIPASQLSSLSRHRFVVIDSFNDWKSRVTLEPAMGDRSQSQYVAALRRQLAIVA